MWTLALLISIWIIGAACVCLMKKIEPSNKMAILFGLYWWFLLFTAYSPIGGFVADSSSFRDEAIYVMRDVYVFVVPLKAVHRRILHLHDQENQ